MATAADIVDFKLPNNAGEDSYDLLPALLGRAARPSGKPSCITPISACFPFVSKTGSWNSGLGSGGFSDPAHIDPVPGGPQGQLYDLARDPAESENVYLQHPDVVARLTALLDRYRQQGYSRAMR